MIIRYKVSFLGGYFPVLSQCYLVFVKKGSSELTLSQSNRNLDTVLTSCFCYVYLKVLQMF